MLGQQEKRSKLSATISQKTIKISGHQILVTEGVGAQGSDPSKRHHLLVWNHILQDLFFFLICLPFTNFTNRHGTTHVLKKLDFEFWYLKLLRDLCGPALRDLYLRFVQNNEAFGSTNFFKPVRDFVKRLNSYCLHVNLESCPITDAKVLLRDAIYEELNMHWTQYDGSHTCHAIHSTWKPLRWQR